MQENPESNPESDKGPDATGDSRRFFIKKSSALVLGVTLVDLIGGAMPAFAIAPEDVDQQCVFKQTGHVWSEADIDSTCGQTVVPGPPDPQYTDADSACGSGTDKPNLSDIDGNCQNEAPTGTSDADESCNMNPYPNGERDSDAGCNKMNGPQADQDDYCGFKNNKADDTCNKLTRKWMNANDQTCGNIIVPTPDSAIRDPDEQCIAKHTIFANGVNEDGNCGTSSGAGAPFEADNGCNKNSQGTDPDQWCKAMHAVGATNAVDQSAS